MRSSPPKWTFTRLAIPFVVGLWLGAAAILALGVWGPSQLMPFPPMPRWPARAGRRASACWSSVEGVAFSGGGGEVREFGSVVRAGDLWLRTVPGRGHDGRRVTEQGSFGNGCPA